MRAFIRSLVLGGYNMFKVFYKIGRFGEDNRRVFLLFSAFFFLFLISIFYCGYKLERQKDIKRRFYEVYRESKKTLATRELKVKDIERYEDIDPYFLSKNIEAMELKKVEKGYLKRVLKNPAFSRDRALEKRLDSLKKNVLSFKRERRDEAGLIRESVERQKRDVEIDVADMEEILSLIESGDAPLMFITDLTLTRKKDGGFMLEDMRIVRREFLKGAKR